MAKRETAAERRARAVAEREEQNAREWAEFVTSYPVRFANVLFNWMYEEFEVTQVDSFTYEFNRKYTHVRLTVQLPQVYTWELINALEEVEQELRKHQEEQEEQKRKFMVRQAALAKLSKEERELLNL